MAWLSALLVGVMALSSPVRADPATVLVFGDSLSAGYGLAAGHGWVSLLEARLRAEGRTQRIVNASVSGETSAGGASRIEATLARERPAIVILELGANDGLRGLPVAQMSANLERIIQASQRAGARVLLVGMRMPPNYGERYTNEFSGAFAQLARRHALPFVPFLLERLGADPTRFQSDGLHPTGESQQALLDTVWPVLRPLLDEGRRNTPTGRPRAP
jgi:acyl-CoA thioesterase-1